jgi:thiamine biosynthesis lipoprotein
VARAAKGEIRGRRVTRENQAGTSLAPDGRTHHLFDPRTGRSANTYRAVTVVAARATVADALSSAIYVAPRAEAARLLHAGGGIEARLVDNAGQVQRVCATVPEDLSR